MDLQTFLTRVNTGLKFFIFYKSEDGKIKNICYQNKKFFSVIRTENKQKVRYVNPIRAVEKLNEIQNGKLKVIGLGRYAKPINFQKDYFYRYKRRIG